MIKNKILYYLSQLDQEKNQIQIKNKKEKNQENKLGIYSSKEIQLRKEKASQILEVMRVLKIIPISVQQRVLAIHPESKELRTAKILTAAIKKGSLFEIEPQKYRA